ncbi:MAG: DNA-methyltransferase [Desulfococcaceae bacterium]
MLTRHRIYRQNSNDLSALANHSVDLVVTSPPYPMIEMWDDLFRKMDPAVDEALGREDGPAAFEAMNRLLDPVWAEVRRVVKPGGLVCVNIGDAVRSQKGTFALHMNHARIASAMLADQFVALPAILWRKQTNAPNKFMGSGMLPAGAYVTLEHEFILIFRNGDKRTFAKPADKQARRESAFFWEERNLWFSDVWMDLKGARQHLVDKSTRERSAAFPFELPYRLIQMFSLRGDTVLDPFMGAGTTAAAAMASARNSVGYELSADLPTAILSDPQAIMEIGNQRVADRFARHLEFVEERTRTKGPLKHTNEPYGFPVMTKQETALKLYQLQAIRATGKGQWEADHAFLPLDAGPEIPDAPERENSLFPQELGEPEVEATPPTEPVAGETPPADTDATPKKRRGPKTTKSRVVPEKAQRDLWE